MRWLANDLDGMTICCYSEPMIKEHSTIIRPFDGTSSDAEGVLLVERATFDESPYRPEQIQAMLTGGPQWAWVALAGGRIVGFA